MLTINYDPKHDDKKSWLVLGLPNSLPGHCLTLQRAIDVVMSTVKVDDLHRCGLWNMGDGSWAFSIMDGDDREQNYEVLLDVPHSELPYILQTYGQMLPCKFRS